MDRPGPALQPLCQPDSETGSTPRATDDARPGRGGASRLDRFPDPRALAHRSHLRWPLPRTGHRAGTRRSHVAQPWPKRLRDKQPRRAVPSVLRGSRPACGRLRGCSPGCAPGCGYITRLCLQPGARTQRRASPLLRKETEPVFSPARRLLDRSSSPLPGIDLWMFPRGLLSFNMYIEKTESGMESSVSLKESDMT